MDDPGIIIVSIFIVVIILLNIVATFVAINTHFEIKVRRYYQIALIWALPFIGALMVIIINKEDYFHQKSKKQIGNNTSIKQSDEATVYVAMKHKGGR